MSDFSTARIQKCIHCGEPFASCEGPLCDCETACPKCGGELQETMIGDEEYTLCKDQCGYMEA